MKCYDTHVTRDDTRSDTHVTHDDMRRSLHMTDKNYTISELSEEFKKDKQLIRRRLSKLGIKPVNKETREHINEPLEYNQNAYLELSNLFKVSKSSKTEEKNDRHVTRDDTQSNTHQKEEKSNKEILIEVLERELKHSKEKLEKAEQEKENLYILLSQQQQLSLSDRNKIKTLEIELEETSKESFEEEKKEIIAENIKTKWYEFWK